MITLLATQNELPLVLTSLLSNDYKTLTAPFTAIRGIIFQLLHLPTLMTTEIFSYTVHIDDLFLACTRVTDASCIHCHRIYYKYSVYVN